MRGNEGRGPFSLPPSTVKPETAALVIGWLMAAVIRGCERLGWDYNELAKQSGIAKTTVNGYWTGYSEPNAATVARLLRLVGVKQVRVPPE